MTAKKQMCLRSGRGCEAGAGEMYVKAPAADSAAGAGFRTSVDGLQIGISGGDG